MRVFKFFLIAVTILINKSASERPNVYFDEVGFIVGIFEKNPLRQNEILFVGQGVVIGPDKVITSSEFLHEDADLQVRAYNWPKNNRQKDKKPSMSDYQERKVEEIKLVTELSLLQLLILEEPFENSVPSINYIDYYSTDVYNMGNKCALVKLKYKDSNVYHKLLGPTLKIKQRKIAKQKSYRPEGCSTKVRSIITKIHMNVFRENKYFCVTETGKKYCNSYPGAALICQSLTNDEIYLAGIQILNDNCELMFQNTQTLPENIE
ncbi:uncharacterized protein LOC103578751 [Microplitis demolitor]|uniref:uncharacterized protein LOC103578751 n=1 Tax=Microplitis demolitor TaxID=69319 RepID=UPI0004CCD8F7|nr:uncharacterized protein LOC103578751 [Microplitis demolitor]